MDWSDIQKSKVRNVPKTKPFVSISKGAILNFSKRFLAENWNKLNNYQYATLLYSKNNDCILVKFSRDGGGDSLKVSIKKRVPINDFSKKLYNRV